MKGKMLLVAPAMLIVSGYIQAQTPGQVPIFDPNSAPGSCNSSGGIDCVDSVITQDPSGNIGIGTTSPVAKLDVAGNVNLETSTATSGNIYKGRVLFLHNFGSNNTFLGYNAGNLTMSGVQNTVTGAWAFQYNASPRAPGQCCRILRNDSCVSTCTRHRTVQ